MPHAGRPPRTGRGLPGALLAGRPSECSGSPGPSYVPLGLRGPSNPHKHRWMGPWGADTSLGCQLGASQSSPVLSRCETCPSSGRALGLGWNGLGAGLPTLVPVTCPGGGVQHGFSRGRPAGVLSPCPCVPRCPSSGWPWNRSYTESTPTRATSGATVSRAGIPRPLAALSGAEPLRALAEPHCVLTTQAFPPRTVADGNTAAVSDTKKA